MCRSRVLNSPIRSMIASLSWVAVGPPPPDGAASRAAAIAARSRRTGCGQPGSFGLVPSPVARYGWRVADEGENAYVTLIRISSLTSGEPKFLQAAGRLMARRFLQAFKSDRGRACAR